MVIDVKVNGLCGFYFVIFFVMVLCKYNVIYISFIVLENILRKFVLKFFCDNVINWVNGKY